MKNTGVFLIRGFVIVLAHVRNVYPVEKSVTGYSWGFKFTDGFYESFDYKSKADAEDERKAFTLALADYWEKWTA